MKKILIYILVLCFPIFALFEIIYLYINKILINPDYYTNGDKIIPQLNGVAEALILIGAFLITIFFARKMLKQINKSVTLLLSLLVYVLVFVVLMLIGDLGIGVINRTFGANILFGAYVFIPGVPYLFVTLVYIAFIPKQTVSVV